MLSERSKEELNLTEAELEELEEKKKILDKYCRIIKLDRPISLEEILDLEEDTWLYRCRTVPQSPPTEGKG